MSDEPRVSEETPATEENIAEKVRARVAAEAAGLAAEDEAPGPEFTSKFILECHQANEVGDGTMYASMHRCKFVFCKSMDTWLKWTDHHWAVDEMDEAKAAVENVSMVYLAEANRIGEKIKDLKGDPDSDSKIKRLEKTQKNLRVRVKDLRGMRRRNNCLLSAHTCTKPLSIHGRELDQKPWLLPVANGVVNLKTGKLQAGRPEDYMMRACPTEYYGIDVPREAWEKALDEIFEEDDLLVSYIRRLFGMALIGAVYEHIFPVLTGPGGRNGKSTIIETISAVVGPLAGPIRPEMLLDTYQIQSSAGPTPDIMDLRGLRFAFASETKDGVKISCARVKWFTGGTELTGRAPHDKSSTTFKPTHTIFLDSNFKPSADANDKAFWERIQNIPFNIRFLKNREPKADNERKADLFLKEKLIKEAPGILGWLVQGCLEWQAEGLNPPPKVIQETDDYMAEEDNFGAFVDHCLAVEEDAVSGASDLYDAFELWWKRYVGKFPPKQKTFGKRMRDRFVYQKVGGVYKYFGVTLSDEWVDYMAENQR